MYHEIWKEKTGNQNHEATQNFGNRYIKVKEKLKDLTKGGKRGVG